MPNWVTNTIHLSDNSSGSRVRECIRYILNENGDVDFNRIIPLPEELAVESGSMTTKTLNVYKDFLNYIGKPFEDVTASDEAEYINTHSDENIIEYFNRGKQYYNNIVKYGYPTWYEWRCARWGCKWNASNSYIDIDCGVVEFETAWSTPEPLIAAWSALFEDVTFEVLFVDEDIFGGNVGAYTYENGELINEYYPDSTAEDLMRFLSEEGVMDEDTFRSIFMED